MGNIYEKLDINYWIGEYQDALWEEKPEGGEGNYTDEYEYIKSIKKGLDSTVRNGNNNNKSTGNLDEWMRKKGLIK